MTNKSRTIIDREKIFFIGFALYLIQSFFSTTMYIKLIPSSVFKITKIAAIILVALKIITDKYTKKQIMVIFITIILFLCSLMESTYSILMEYIILIIGAKDIPFNKIVKLFFEIELVLSIITIISAQAGIIEDLIYLRKKNNKYRHSFGFIYTTDCVAHIFFLCLAYTYIKGKNIKWYNIVLILFVAIITYFLCDSRLDSLSIIMTIIIAILNKYDLVNFKNLMIKYVLIFGFLICEVFSLYLSINYNSTNRFYVEMDKFMSSRLRIGNMMYNRYGIKAFGQHIDDHGAGGSVVFIHDEYNYIDCSYLRILLKYGWTVSAIITIMNILISIKLYKNHKYNLLLINLLILVNCIIAQHYIDFSYNFLLLVYLAKLDDETDTMINKINDEKEILLK